MVEAGDGTMIAKGFDRRIFDPAALGRKGAARLKGAAGRKSNEARRCSLDGSERGALESDTRHGAEKPASIGMVRLGEGRSDCARLDYPPGRHYGHAVPGRRDHAQIVR